MSRTVLQEAIKELLWVLQWIVSELAYYACKDTVEDESAGQKPRLVLWKLAIPKRIGGR